MKDIFDIRHVQEVIVLDLLQLHSGSLYSGDTKSNSFLHYNELYTKKKSHHIVYFNNISCDIHYSEFD